MRCPSCNRLIDYVEKLSTNTTIAYLIEDKPIIDSKRNKVEYGNEEYAYFCPLCYKRIYNIKEDYSDKIEKTAQLSR